MITVMELEAALRKARNSGALKGSDVLAVSPRTGNLSIIRNTVYVGSIDMATAAVRTYPMTIKGASPQVIIVDEISAFLEAKEPGRTDEDGKDVLYQHMAANEGLDVAEVGLVRDEDVDGPPKPYIQRGEGI